VSHFITQWRGVETSCISNPRQSYQTAVYDDNTWIYVKVLLCKVIYWLTLANSIELDEVRAVEWRTGRGREYRVDFVSIPEFIQRQRLYSPLAANNTAEKLDEKSRAQAIITDKLVDLRPICPRVFNQGDLGTCGVTNFTSLIEWTTGTWKVLNTATIWHVSFTTGKKLSVLFLYWNTRVKVDNQLPYDDSGSEYDSMLKAVYDCGMCADELWPYNSAKFLEEPPKEGNSFVYEAHY